MTAPDVRFWERVDKDANEKGCWIWRGKLDAAGRGGFNLSPGEGKKWIAAHRYAYESVMGSIPEGKKLSSLCRTPGCVRPDHWDVLTWEQIHQERQAGAWQREKTHCPKGHPYDEENTYLYRGSRLCRACRGLRPASRARQWRNPGSGSGADRG